MGGLGPLGGVLGSTKIVGVVYGKPEEQMKSRSFAAIARIEKMPISVVGYGCGIGLPLILGFP